MMCGVSEVTDVDEPYENANNGDNLGKHVTKVVEFALEWSLFADLRRDGFVNVSNSSSLTSVDNDCSCASVNHCSTLHAEKESDYYLGHIRLRRRLTEKSMLVMSCFTALGSATTLTDLCTLTLSPVKIAWSTRKLPEDTERSLQSAGILSPTATAITSPGTSSEACRRVISPSRMTFASSGEYSLRA